MNVRHSSILALATLSLLASLGLGACSPWRNLATPDANLSTERAADGATEPGRDAAPSTPDGPATNGVVTDSGTSEPLTTPGCQTGFHMCGGDCKDSSRPETCGSNCDPCPAIAGGKAICTNGLCGTECPSGQKACQDKCIAVDLPCGTNCTDGKNFCHDICVAATDKTACGQLCTPCPSPQNGASTCDGTQCSLTCNSGFHLCGDSCKVDADATACGQSCVACEKPTGGEAVCEAGKCEAKCPAGMTVCFGKCIPDGQACMGQCEPGRHNCGGNCVDETQPATCGALCMPCPSPPNGEPTCGPTKTCSFKCRSGYHQCGQKCESDDNAAACGPSCTACPVPSNGSATCQNGTCGQRCKDGFHLCQGQCKSNSDVNSCGGSCNPCPSPANGKAACKTGSCGFTCDGGFKPCADKCCSCVLCTAGQKRCQGGVPQECVKNGACADWVTGQNPCASGDTRCGSGGGIQTCSAGADGCLAWSNEGGCPQGQTCPSGANKCGCAESCAPKDSRCKAGTIQVCTTVGGCPAWGDFTMCSSGCGKIGTSISCCDGCTVGDTRNCDRITNRCDTCTQSEPGCTYWLAR